MKLNRVLGIFIGSLILIGLSVSVFFNYKLNSDLEESHKELDSYVEDNSVLNQDMLDCQDNVVDLEAAVDEANEAVDEAVEEYDRLKASMLSMDSELGELRSELIKKEALLMCDYPLKNISFSSNSAVSRDLKTWVSDRAGSVYNAEWDVIWSNTRDSIHYIRVKKDSGNVMYVFVAYLDNKRNPESVFYVDSQCWLYLAE